MSIYFNAENGGKRFAGYHSTKIYAQRSVCGSQSIVEYCSASYDLESFGTVLSIITNIECNKTLTEIVKVITISEGWKILVFMTGLYWSKSKTIYHFVERLKNRFYKHKVSFMIN